ncbi:MAG: hypothetical protein ACT4RN_01870 [Pseudonocardia sp.]
MTGSGASGGESMVAVVEGGVSPLEQRRKAPVLHRLVAVAISPAEVRPGSELLTRLAGVDQVDLLVVTDGDDDGRPEGSDDDDDVPDAGDRVREAAAGLGLRVDVHRLGLRVPADRPRPRDVDDVVAAISELVGFDPEPGVGCVVPVRRRGRGRRGPADLVIGRAVERVVAAYRLPLLTYVPLAG